MASVDQLSFEEALKKLESVVEQLESEEVSLEESIALYEEGMKLSQYCTDTLEQAKQRIEKVDQQHTQDAE